MATEFKNAHWMNARFDSRCNDCEESILEGDDIVYAPEIKKAYCETCGEQIVPRKTDEDAASSVAEVRARMKAKKRGKS